MEVFIRGVPTQANNKQMHDFLEPVLKDLSIDDWSCSRRKGKPFANLTFLHHSDGQKFLGRYGQRRLVGRPALMFQGATLACIPDKFGVDQLALKSLQLDAKARQLAADGLVDQAPSITSHSMKCVLVSCGIWDYMTSTLVFRSYCDLDIAGNLVFGSKSVSISSADGLQIDTPINSIHSITVQGLPRPAITMQLIEPPHCYRPNLVAMMLGLGLSGPGQNQPTHDRVPGLNAVHEKVAGSNMVYRFWLSEPISRDQVKSLSSDHRLPSMIRRTAEMVRGDFAVENQALQTAFATNFSKLPFAVMYQVQRLAQNGYLPAKMVLRLLPEISRLFVRTNVNTCVAVLRRILKRLDFPGPEADAKDYQLAALEEWMRDIEASINMGGLDAMEVRQSNSLATTHRVHVTPSGIYLNGPEQETPNRVLRKYPEHHDYFLRVQFCEEDLDRLFYDSERSNDPILYQRFRQILDKGMNICGRLFKFLGFSHSSLRAQSCWFMAPFVFEGNLVIDQVLIDNLGDFSHIRCPAKCAARIGQSFSDTPTAITLPTNVFYEIDDVEHAGRVFSDGVGTVSMAIVKKIWKVLPVAREKGTTVFQIRYKGAKGMIALDSTLLGDALCLRKSMIKFPCSTSSDLEICGGAYRPLPAYLNQQSIKILEDMGVSDDFFLLNQKEEILRLRSACSNPVNASSFLQTQHVGTQFSLPWLITKLQTLSLSFKSDKFLRNVVEVAVLVELRALKYAARIPIAEGHTLFGVMDETGIIEEGQVFCTVDVKGRPTIITRRDVVITRAPALHPGDVQIVNAVTVPEDSPLRQLRNCICFSQHGTRDLPSQLSGGDLDGDLFQIILDPKARPKHYFHPADYHAQPPVDLGRSVTREDMTKFYTEFMATDQLGRIATRHKILADQSEEGTKDLQCIVLAEMHSTAVNFSKSGVPVDLKKMPKGNNYRPDFMAPGPHVQVEKEKPLFVDRWTPPDRKSGETSSYKFYESQKILGKLYRNIDEQEVFAQVKRDGSMEQIASDPPLLGKLWDAIQYAVQGFTWEHYLERARGIRDDYEYNLTDIAYEYSSTHRPISELEVFVGNILGKTGAQSKRLKELSTSMRERFGAVVIYIVGRIKGHDEDGGEALERSLACFQAGLEPRYGALQHGQNYVSFAYIAATVCLKEVERFLDGM